MAFAIDTFEKQTVEAWEQYMDSLEKSLEGIERDIAEAVEMSETCTGEWCAATEHVLDELGNALFSISEPRWAPEEHSRRLKFLKRRLHEAYARYRGAAERRVA
jgi:hypothetical protein